MKRILIYLSLLLTACGQGQVSVLDVPTEIESEKILIIVGEGGTSGNLFRLAALTYQREQGGDIIEVGSGDAFVNEVKSYVETNGPIDHMEYFGHGNNVALFVNQLPGVNGALYANDPMLNEDYVAASIYELPSTVFSSGGTVQFNGCNLAKDHEEAGTFAQDFSNHFQVVVTAAEGPTQFSSSPDLILSFDEWNELHLTAEDDVYMIPSYLEEGFVVLTPGVSSRSGYSDVYRGTLTVEAIDWLTDQGIDFGSEFKPYSVANADDLLRVCEHFAWPCDLEPGSNMQSTVEALAILMDGAGLDLASTTPWYDAYVRHAQSNELMLEGFTDRRWFTRADLAYLLYKIMTL